MTKSSSFGTEPDGDVAPLADVLAYRNDLVVRRFMKRFDISRNDADLIFVELLRWLWYLASAKSAPDNPEAHAIDEPLLIIDEMWHEFIIVTRDYTNFCNDLCGRYIHHAPNSGEDPRPEHEGLDELKTSLAARIARKRAKYTAIYDILGKDVFILWYLDFPRRYSEQVIARMRQKTGRVDTPSEDVIDIGSQVTDQDKDELIEEALFMNLILALPDEAGTWEANEQEPNQADERAHAQAVTPPAL